jgi:hypothetical protein
MFFYLVFVQNKRLAAIFALIAVTVAFFFNIVLIGLTANIIQLDQNFGLTNNKQYQLLSAILAIALFIFTLCIAFFIMFTIVFFSSSTRRWTKY